MRVSRFAGFTYQIRAVLYSVAAIGLRSDAPQHQPIEPAGERRRILRQFAVEDLRLLQQQQRQIASARPSAAAIAATSGWRMLISRIGFVTAPRFCCASMRSSARSRPSPPATRHDALVVSRCDARTSDTRSPSASLITAMIAASSAAGLSLSFSPELVVEQRDQTEIDVALAQRFQRLAAEIERRRGPERVDRIGQQQHLDAARLGRFELRVRLQALDAVADQIIDLGLVRLEVLDILLQRALVARRWW